MLAIVWTVVGLGALCSHEARAQVETHTDDARKALAAGDVAGAETLAQSRVQADPQDADAWLVLGLAKFRSGDAAEALADFERASAGQGNAPAPELLFNRGACLFQLGRNEAAERTFSALADDPRSAPELAALAALNAGFSALELQAYERASAHLQKARALDRQGALGAQADELASELASRAQQLAQEARTLERRGQTSGAEQALSRARALAPEDGALLYDAGLLAYNRGDRETASMQLRAARARGLDPTRERAAETYLDVLAGGLRRWGKGPSALVALGGGYDSNISQSGLSDSSALVSGVTAAQGAPFGRVAGEVDYGVAPSDALFLLAAYQLEQLAYTRSELDLFNAQDHALELQAELQLGERWRVRAGARAALGFAGLSEFRPFSLSGRGEAALTLRHGGALETALVGSVLGTRALDDAYTFLSGHRLELGLSESYDQVRMRAGVSVTYVDDARGTQQIAGVQSEACRDCGGAHVVPLSYYGPRLALWLSHPLFSSVRGLLRLTGEYRLHHEPTYFLGMEGALAQQLGAKKQQDLRLSAQLTVRIGLVGPLDLELGYRFTYALSNIDSSAGGSHVYDYADLNFLRHEAELSLSAFF